MHLRYKYSLQVRVDSEKAFNVSDMCRGITREQVLEQRNRSAAVKQYNEQRIRPERKAEDG
jgi:hypothetical protein